MSGSNVPQNGDIVVVATNVANGMRIYVLQIHPRMDRFLTLTREEAVSHALAYAALRRVHAWLLEAENDFVLIDGVRPAMSEA